MYLCQGCHKMFFETDEHYVEGTWYPEPHDRGGSVCVGGDCWVEGCPYCGCDEYYECDWDGFCPNCDYAFEDIEKFCFKNLFTEITCPCCKRIIEIDSSGDMCDCREN